ncbi:MAG: tyrosine--tRNA ligase [Minisyncoccia bacterium]
MLEKTENKIDILLTRGVEEIIEKDSLILRLKSKKKLIIKHGIDPTGPKIHLGRALQFWKLKEFQDLGHKVVLILGDFTAQIGDASDKLSQRKPLSEKEVKENMRDYKKQIGKILDLKKTEIYRNSQWHNKSSLKDIVKIIQYFTAQQMIHRKNFQERWERGNPISLAELLYPILQGIDSLMIKADVEVGGSDQLFNLKIGREIQKLFGQKPQDIMTLELLPGLDGQKMSTSVGNVINILDKPEEMYGKLMSMRDEAILPYLKLHPILNEQQRKELEEKLKDKNINPKDIKEIVAFEITKLYCAENLARKAKENFEILFKKKLTPDNIPIFEIKKTNYPILDLLFDTKLVSSKSEAKRLILQGGVKINDKVEKDFQKILEIRDNMIIKIGKRKFLKLKTK